MTSNERDAVRQFLLGIVAYELLPKNFPSQQELLRHPCCVSRNTEATTVGTVSSHWLAKFLEHFPDLPDDIRDVLLATEAARELQRNV